MPQPGYAPAASYDRELGDTISEGSDTSPILPLRRNESAESLLSAVSQDATSRLTESQSVRINVAQSVAAVPGENQSRTNIIVVIRTILQLPPAVAAAVVLPLSRQNKEHCAQPLAFWATMYAFGLFLSVLCAWVLHLSSASRPQDMSTIRRWAEYIVKPLENFNVVWILLGQVWLQNAESCEATSPMLMELSIWLIVLGFCYLLLPCIIIILMMPFLCFCLPCVIRVLARFAGTELKTKGASQEAINALSTVKYHHGMFEEEDDPQCSICLSAFEPGEQLRILPCDGQHSFHKDCCDEWLLVNATCPICRARVIGSNEESTSEMGSESDANV
mmetsp:Transcript_8072/g.14880  ORF Transcript_8072/g.14880 Transcript_8072/m.14880 type:complete len:333 (-) Transcript_8072:236-1234(-)